MALGVEELGAQDVGAELLGRADRDRLDLGAALEPAVGQRGRDVGERAAEERDALVADGEPERRVDGIGGVRAGERRGGGGRHGWPPTWISGGARDKNRNLLRLQEPP